MRTAQYNRRFFFSLSSLLILASFEIGQAQTVVKAAAGTNLSLGASYVGGNPPTGSDTIVFNNTLTGPLTLNSAGISVFGLDFQSTATPIMTFSTGSLTLGAGGLTKNDPSTRTRILSEFILSANQIWNVNTSQLQFEGSGSITTGVNTVTIQGAGNVSFSGSTTVLNNNVTIANTGSVLVTTGSAATLQGNNTFTTLTINGNSTLSGNTLRNFGEASSFGTGGINNAIILGSASGTGTLIYTGNTTTSNRSFQRFVANASNPGLNTAAIEVTTAGQTLTLTGAFTHNSSTVTNSGWRFGGAGNLTIDSVIPNTGGGGQNAVLKDGNGTLRLLAANTYGGQTTVSAGTLLVNGQTGTDSGTGTGAVVVQSGASLGGTGRIAGAVTITGALTPGDGGIGTLTVDNSLTWNGGGSNWVFNLGAANASDLLSLTGASGSFLKGTGSGWTFDFLGAAQTGTFSLVNWSNSTSFAATDFNYTNLASGFTGDFAISGNTLQFTVIPEPSTAALLLLAAGGLYKLRKRRSVA